jgi:hypothetical protein
MVQVCSTGTITVNAAFLQEIKEVDLELLQLLAALRSRCAATISTHHVRGVVVLLQDLRDQLALHFALEEAYGYFEEPMHAAPQLSHEAERLRAEHKELYLDLCQMTDQAEVYLSDGEHALLGSWLAPRFISFDIRLKRHETRENELILDAYECDLGGGD